MSQKVREIGTIVFGFISGVNAIYQLLFRQDIALFFLSVMVSRLAFYTWVNRDNPDKFKRLSHGLVVVFIGMVAATAFYPHHESFFWI